jgi:hypothetical protein
MTVSASWNADVLEFRSVLDSHPMQISIVFGRFDSVAASGCCQ